MNSRCWPRRCLSNRNDLCITNELLIIILASGLHVQATNPCYYEVPDK